MLWFLRNVHFFLHSSPEQDLFLWRISIFPQSLCSPCSPRPRSMFHTWKPSFHASSSSGGVGVHVQPDRGHRRSHHAQSLRLGGLGGQSGAHLLPRLHEVSLHEGDVSTSFSIWPAPCDSSPRSYMTTTFVIEAMAAANAQLRWKRREQEEVRTEMWGGRTRSVGP